MCAPEETHFFRWAEPYGTEDFERSYLKNKVFRQHRELDGLNEFDFFYTLQQGRHRKDLMDNYARIFKDNNNHSGKRWFDKSPQNVYGMLLLSAMYPESRFIHIHRHPYNVVASLRAGGMLARQPLRGAINYWLESVHLVNEYRKGFPDRVHELRYRDLCDFPLETVNGILAFLGEKPIEEFPEDIVVGDEQDRYRGILTDEELTYIRDCCGDMLNVYGYEN